jgi:predicted aspartyl protease
MSRLRRHPRDDSVDDMRIFRTSVVVESIATPARRQTIDDVMVDSGSEYNWFAADVLYSIGVTPVRRDRFETADGRVLERDVGFAVVYAGGRSAPTLVVFGEPGDMTLLGAHGLEGLNLRVDLARKALVPAGPVPAALVG